ncbi:unnamed protein product (macronuclear) [Paramecium tetraurelia]|uniref:Uncharacterized protein n=1 Tax=Paramecium tetraurelia TaxID=5888 RepID=A0E9I2_PARTE|nr:uncharacterized protein GSPATT00024680001 [Paramecium tetraurelia]CAK91949.1 unnamed protein product [Paramecium tetraurelia]|eukprot:XP_001459346.1 hypothetical protein (macronuclear) [Paramecium tetraurelia strain d4-2]
MRVCALLCMVAITQCTQITNQASMFDEQLGKLSNSKLGKTILNMITLQQFTDVDFSLLFTALDDMLHIAKLSVLKCMHYCEIKNYHLSRSIYKIQVRLGELSHLPHLFEPLSRVLTEMSTSGFADQEQVGNAIKLLHSLRGDLVAFKQALQMNAQVERTIIIKL